MRDMLQIVHRGVVRQTLVVRDEPVDVGRAFSCALQVEDEAVPLHCLLILRKDGVLYVKDLRKGEGADPSRLPLRHPVPLSPHTHLMRQPLEEKEQSTSACSLPRYERPTFLVVHHTGVKVNLHRSAAKVLGQSRDCDVVLHDNTVSRYHCRLERSGQAWFVRDLGSRNGTWLNGNQVICARLQSGDRLQLGHVALSLGHEVLECVHRATPCLSVDAARNDAARHNATSDKATKSTTGSGQPLHDARPQEKRPFVAESPAFRAALRRCETFAPLPWPVHLFGESGAGKEVLARHLHAQRNDASGKRTPFVAVNAGALPKTLLESELFGHVRGAFTGATETRRGAFELAEDGVMFLDEIGELPWDGQAHLLRVLDQMEVQPVGGGNKVPVRCRVVTATNRDLRSMVRVGAFREDLYFRIAHLRLEVPPLRERPEDIPSLTTTILNELGHFLGRKTLAHEAVALLLAHHWPGNVRELRNVLCAAAIESKQVEISGPLIRDAMQQQGSHFLASGKVYNLNEVVAHYGGNMSAASKALCLPRTTLRSWAQAEKKQAEGRSAPQL